MTEINNTQKYKIKIYSELLDVDKRVSIIKILKLFYDKSSWEYNTSVVDWLENQIIFFLDPYGFKNIYQKKRKIFLDKISKKLEDCEYRNLSLDKIVLFLFSWSKEELEIFYKNNKSKVISNSEKSVYNLKLRELPQNGGGYSNDFVLKYINSLKNKENFKKTVIYFNYLNKVNEEYNNYNFLSHHFKLKELYINKDTPFIDIDKLFLYLLNLPIEKLDELISKIEIYFIKFEPNKELFKFPLKNKDNNIEYSDKKWFYSKKISFNECNYKFYKLFDQKLVISTIITTPEGYIKKIIFLLFDSSSINYNTKYNFYFYFDLISKYNIKKFSIGNNKKTKEILTNAKNDLIKLINFIKND
jgi:hypothetical protein